MTNVIVWLQLRMVHMMLGLGKAENQEWEHSKPGKYVVVYEGGARWRKSESVTNHLEGDEVYLETTQLAEQGVGFIVLKFAVGVDGVSFA